MATDNVYTRKNRREQVSGQAQFVFAKDRNYYLDGFAATYFSPAIKPRTISRYAHSRRDGRLLMLNEAGDVIFYCQFSKDKPDGILCFCVKGVPRLVQRWSAGELKAGYLVIPYLTLQAVPDSDLEPWQAELYAEAMAASGEIAKALDEENAMLKRDFKKWWQTESDKQRKKRAAELGRIKHRLTEARGKARDTAAQADLDRLKSSLPLGQAK